MTVPRMALAAAVKARLETLAGVTVYDGEVPSRPPVIPDGTGRVMPYVVIYPSPGRPHDDADLGECNDDLDWTVQVTCAAGHVRDLLDLVDRVHSLLHRWAPVVDGVNVGRLQWPRGYDAGPSRRDEDVDPPRHFLPLLYVLAATAN